MRDMRNNFPIIEVFQEKNIVYLDSASTSLKLRSVIDAVNNFYTNQTSNVYRGLHSIAESITGEIERSRDLVASFIGANSNEVVFTSNATEGINIVANGLRLKNNSEIVVSILEHHSNFLPWNSVAQVRKVQIDSFGYISLDGLQKAINKNTKLVSVTYLSNITGNIQPIEQIIKIAHKAGVKVLVDATQAISHIPVNVKELDCDYLVFSSHKIFGPSGLGVLYGKSYLLEELDILKFGGGMVNKIDNDLQINYKNIPYRLEAGTPNIEGIIGLGAAIEFFVRNKESIYDYLHQIDLYILSRFKNMKLIQFPFQVANKHAPIFTILPDKSMLSSLEIAKILATKYNIVLNHGYQCAQPLYNEYQIKGGSIRLSFHIYNTYNDVDYLISSLEDILNTSTIL